MFVQQSSVDQVREKFKKGKSLKEVPVQENEEEIVDQDMMRLMGFDNEEDVVEVEEKQDEDGMMSMMGFGGFGSSKK